MRNCFPFRARSYPLKRTRIKPKADPKPPSVLHPNKRYPVSRDEWAVQRAQVFTRSDGYCEAVWEGQRCSRRIFSNTFEPHHIVPRSKGGPDTMENLLAVCHACHERIHGVPQWSKRA